MISTSINFLFSYFELSSALICSLTIFRMSIKYNILKIAIIGFIYSLISVYTYSIFPNFALLLNFTCLLILIIVSYHLPFLYSLLIAVIHSLTIGIVEYAAFLFVTKILNFPDSLILPGEYGSKVAYIITSIILLLIAWYLQRKKLGFMFIANRFKIRQALKGYNFLLSAILILSIVLIQLTSILFNQFSIHAIILIFLTVVFLVGIYVAYRQNKRQLKEKHERLQNR